MTSYAIGGSGFGLSDGIFRRHIQNSQIFLLMPRFWIWSLTAIIVSHEESIPAKCVTSFHMTF